MRKPSNSSSRDPKIQSTRITAGGRQPPACAPDREPPDGEPPLAATSVVCAVTRQKTSACSLKSPISTIGTPSSARALTAAISMASARSRSTSRPCRSRGALWTFIT